MRVIPRIGIDQLHLAHPIRVYLVEIPLDRVRKLGRIVRNLGAEHIGLRAKVLAEPDLLIAAPGLARADTPGDECWTALPALVGSM